MLRFLVGFSAMVIQCFFHIFFLHAEFGKCLIPAASSMIMGGEERVFMVVRNI